VILFARHWWPAAEHPGSQQRIDDSIPESPVLLRPLTHHERQLLQPLQASRHRRGWAKLVRITDALSEEIVASPFGDYYERPSLPKGQRVPGLGEQLVTFGHELIERVADVHVGQPSDVDAPGPQGPAETHHVVRNAFRPGDDGLYDVGRELYRPLAEPCGEIRCPLRWGTGASSMSRPNR